MRFQLITFYLCLTTLSISAQNLSDYLSQPFPTQLKSSPSGDHIAWVFNVRGERNVYFASTPDFTAKAITEYKGDNGIDIPQIAMTDHHIIYVRGNAPNSKGEIANPAMITENIERTIYSYSIKGATARTIGPGNQVSCSNDGKYIAYISAGQVHICDINDPTSKPKKLFQSRGAQGQLRWSPDDRHIAFVSHRGDHNFVGITDVTTGNVQFINESFDQDTDPVWNPDGSKLAYVRVPNVHRKLIFEPIRESLPFSIWTFDVSTKKHTQVFTASSGPGSYFTDQVNISDNAILWTAYDQIIFPYEKNGWHQLYAIDLKTLKVDHLTPGEGEVEYAFLSQNRSSLTYVSNIGDIDRKHIYKLDLINRSVTSINNTNHIEWSPTVINGGMAYLHSSHDKAPWPVVTTNNKRFEIATDLKSPSFPAKLRMPEAISIKAVDGISSPAQLFYPSNYDKNKSYPAVIFLHGGSRRQMLMGFQPGMYYSHAFGLNQYFADKGYMVISLNYRSGIGYGMTFREAQGFGATGATEVLDLVAAGEYLAARKDVKKDKIALWGGSYGGYLTAHGLAQRSDLFHCGVDIHGVHDWNDGTKVFNTWYNPVDMPDVSKKAFNSSPLKHIDRWRSPVLLVHGDDDRNVNFSQSVVLLEQLKKRNITHETLVLPDEVHSFLLHRSWVKIYEHTFQFIDKYTQSSSPSWRDQDFVNTNITSHISNALSYETDGIKHFSPAAATPSMLPYSPCVFANGTMYISGQIGTGKDGNLASDFKSEVDMIMTKLKGILSEQNLSFSDLASVTVYLTDMGKYNEFNDIYKSYFSGLFPTRTCVALAALPRNAQVEITATAIMK